MITTLEDILGACGPGALIAGSSIRQRGSHILIADDNPCDIFLLKSAFEASGLPHSISTVSDGAEAISYLRRDGPFRHEPFPELVLLDLNMPRLGGFEVLGWARFHPPCQSLPIVVLSSSTLQEDEQMARALGACDYRIKTGDLARLQRMAVDLHSRWLCPA